MTHIYGILAVGGWIWGIVFAVFLLIKHRRSLQVRGFESIGEEEKQR